MSRNYSAYSVNFARALIALPLFLALAWLNGSLGMLYPFPWKSSLWLGTSILSSFALGDIFFLLSTRSLGVPGSLAIASTYPLWATLAGAIFHGEILPARKVIAICVVVAGVATVILSGLQQTRFQPKKVLEKMTRLDRVGVGALLACATSILWALNAYSVARGSEGLDVATSNAIRMAQALLFCFIVPKLIGRREPALLPIREFRRYTWLFALEGFGGSLTFVYGFQHAPLGIAATLSSLAPVLSAPIAWLRGEPFSPLKTLGILVTVSGIWMLVTA
jgi:drug/metabolite transporter (DMT)-like permease